MNVKYILLSNSDKFKKLQINCRDIANQKYQMPKQINRNKIPSLNKYTFKISTTRLIINILKIV